MSVSKPGRDTSITHGKGSQNYGPNLIDLSLFTTSNADVKEQSANILHIAPLEGQWGYAGYYVELEEGQYLLEGEMEIPPDTTHNPSLYLTPYRWESRRHLISMSESGYFSLGFKLYHSGRYYIRAQANNSNAERDAIFRNVTLRKVV